MGEEEAMFSSTQHGCFQKRINRTFEALSKITNRSYKDFQSIGNGDICQQMKMKYLSLDEEELSFSGSETKSVYMGAGVKLDAFDSFHAVLNKCVVDFAFSIFDAAVFLKLVTPEMIKGMLSCLFDKKENELSKVKSRAAGEEALDNEISEINKEQRFMLRENRQASVLAKRPDAPKPPDSLSIARSFSPGSNSCSPVSAAVHALISISAPLTENITSSHTVMSRTKVEDTKQFPGEFCNAIDGTIIKSLPKTCLRNAIKLKEKVDLTIPKYSNEAGCDGSILGKFREGNLDNSTRNDYGFERQYGISSSCSLTSGSLSFPSSTINAQIGSKMSLGSTFTTHGTFECSNLQKNNVTAVFSDPVSLSNAITEILPDDDTDTQDSPEHETFSLDDSESMLIDEKESQVLVPNNLPRVMVVDMQPNEMAANSHQSQEGTLDFIHVTTSCIDPPQTTLTDSEALLNPYDLRFMSDLPCGLQSPFPQPLPASPITSIINDQLATTQASSSLKERYLKQGEPSRNNLDYSVIVQATTNGAVQKRSVASIQPTFVNTESGSFNEQVDSLIDEVDSLPGRFQSSLRPILPKHPVEPSSNHIVSIITLPKVEEKRQLQYSNSISPSQIFTKVNLIAKTTLPTLVTTSVSSGEQTHPLQNLLSADEIHPFILPHGQGKGDFTTKNIFTLNNPNSGPHAVNANEDETKCDVNSKEIKVTVNIANPEIRGGNLEVASALLSMASENEKNIAKPSEENFQAIILDSLKEERSNVQVIFTSWGTVKIKDVEINPEEHGIRKDNFTCGKCRHVFTSVLYLTRHIKRVCPDMSQRKWKCDRCPKAFRHPFGLQQHIYTHTGERPHKCVVCPKAFYSSNDLRRHARTHSGERPYVCTICGKSFSTTISLKTHLYIHTGERPHRCPHCSKTFATSSKLSRHIVTHSKSKPYTCDQCPKTFNRSGDLRRHYNQHHGSSQSLLECNLCNKVFASQKCLVNHKNTHKRDLGNESVT